MIMIMIMIITVVQMLRDEGERNFERLGFYLGDPSGGKKSLRV